MLGKTIAKLRKMKGLTQADLGSAIHVTPSAISQWETGRTSPAVQQMFILANYFGITVEQLESGVLNTAVSQPALAVVENNDLDAKIRKGLDELTDPQTKEEVLAFIRFKLMERKNKK